MRKKIEREENHTKISSNYKHAKITIKSNYIEKWSSFQNLFYNFISFFIFLGACKSNKNRLFSNPKSRDFEYPSKKIIGIPTSPRFARSQGLKESSFFSLF